MKFLKGVILGMASLLLFLSVARAEEITLVDCEYSEEYLKWSALSEEEKKSHQEPAMCKEMNFSSIRGQTPTENKYNLKDQGKILSEVRNQGASSSCWAFATTEAISSNALFSSISSTYSPVHMELFTQNTYSINGLKTFNRAANSGGNYFISSSYVMNHLGPVLDSTMPYDTSWSETDYLNHLNTKSKSVQKVKPSLDINHVVLKNNQAGACTSDMISFMKTYLKEHGAIAAQLYYTTDGEHPSRKTVSTNTYSISNDYINGAYYYYNGNEISNHGVTIVGWDDTIPSSSFSSYHRPSKAGAWIVKNSYGTSYTRNENGVSVKYLEGDEGYFYVSYEDVNICTSLAGFYDVDQDVSDYSYYYDYLGWNTVLTPSNLDSIYLANKFQKQSDEIEKLDKIVFGSSLEGQEYEIYYSSTGDLNKYAKIGEGVTSHRGYESYNLSNTIVVDNAFSIIVRFKKDASNNLSIVGASGLGDSSSYYHGYSITSNVSYISSNGANWILFNVNNANIQSSIKAFTSKLTTAPSTPSVIDETTTSPNDDTTTLTVLPNANNDEPIPDYVDNKEDDTEIAPTQNPKKDEDEIENPNTGAYLPLILILVISVIALYLLYQAKKKQILFKM